MIGKKASGVELVSLEAAALMCNAIPLSVLDGTAAVMESNACLWSKTAQKTDIFVNFRVDTNGRMIILAKRRGK